MIVYSIKLQHVKSWQELLPILQARGDLEKFCTEILIKLGIHYHLPSIVNDIYVKELPEQHFLGGVVPNMYQQNQMDAPVQGD